MGNNLGCPEKMDAWLVVLNTGALSLFVTFPPDHVRPHASHPERALDFLLARVGNQAAMDAVMSQV
jgi:hypothetical protein